MNQCEGQIEITDYLKSKIKSGRVKDLTDWINSQGKSQYRQIGDIVKNTYEREKDSDDLVDRITNEVSVYVLSMSNGYMKYALWKSFRNCLAIHLQKLHRSIMLQRRKSG